MVMWTNDLQSPHVQAALHSGLHTHLSSHHNQSDGLAPQRFRLDAQSFKLFACLKSIDLILFYGTSTKASKHREINDHVIKF